MLATILVLLQRPKTRVILMKSLLGSYLLKVCRRRSSLYKLNKLRIYLNGKLISNLKLHSSIFYILTVSFVSTYSGTSPSGHLSNLDSSYIRTTFSYISCKKLSLIWTLSKTDNGDTKSLFAL